MSNQRNPEEQANVISKKPNMLLDEFKITGTRSLSTSPTLGSPTRPARKVSFSDFVITSSRVEKGPSHPGTLSENAFEQVTVVERRSDEPVDTATHHIQVRLLDSHDSELLKENPLLTNELPIFEVKLGMLKQATLYRMEFNIPDALPPGEIELLRFTVDTPGSLSVPVNVGANVELLSCDSLQHERGHCLVLQVATTKQPRVNEVFTMRLVQRPAMAIHLILHGLSLGRGQGTPFLRAGIHRIAENADYEDSDEFTEWPGFVNENDDSDDTDDDNDANALSKDASNVNQGDKQDISNDVDQP